VEDVSGNLHQPPSVLVLLMWIVGYPKLYGETNLEIPSEWVGKITVDARVSANYVKICR
jgi:hypothetical protein